MDITKNSLKLDKMNNLREYQSHTSGLWVRFITKLIGAWVFIYFVTYFVLGLLVPLINLTKFAIPILIILLVFVTWLLFKDNPLRWRNTVTFDFQKEVITIQKANSSNSDSDILDFEGNRYPFKTIESYSTIQYESFLFNAFYLIKIFVNGKEVKLLSFKSPNEFNELLGIFKNRMKINPK